MISAAQLRAARGLLDWTRAELAKASGLSPETIKNIEHGIFKPTETTTLAIVNTFALHDIMFTEHDGVMRRKELVKTFYGKDGFRSFFDELYETTKNTGQEICIYGVDESQFMKHLGDYAAIHISRMTEIKAKVRCLIREGDSDVYCDAYNEYRCLPERIFSSVPFYIFSGKFAVVIFNTNVTVVQVESAPVFEAYLKQYEVIWEESKPLGLRKKKQG